MVEKKKPKYTPGRRKVLNPKTNKYVYVSTPLGKKLTERKRSRSRSKSPKRTPVRRLSPSRKKSLKESKRKCLSKGKWWSISTRRCRAMSPTEKRKFLRKLLIESKEDCIKAGGKWNNSTKRCRGLPRGQRWRRLSTTISSESEALISELEEKRDVIEDIASTTINNPNVPSEVRALVLKESEAIDQAIKEEEKKLLETARNEMEKIPLLEYSTPERMSEGRSIPRGVRESPPPIFFDIPRESMPRRQPPLLLEYPLRERTPGAIRRPTSDMIRESGVYQRMMQRRERIKREDEERAQRALARKRMTPAQMAVYKRLDNEPLYRTFMDSDNVTRKQDELVRNISGTNSKNAAMLAIIAGENIDEDNIRQLKSADSIIFNLPPALKKESKEKPTVNRCRNVVQLLMRVIPLANRLTLFEKYLFALSFTPEEMKRIKTMTEKCYDDFMERTSGVPDAGLGETLPEESYEAVKESAESLSEFRDEINEKFGI